jgi:hypothetical protein
MESDDTSESGNDEDKPAASMNDERTPASGKRKKNSSAARRKRKKQRSATSNADEDGAAGEAEAGEAVLSVEVCKDGGGSWNDDAADGASEDSAEVATRNATVDDESDLTVFNEQRERLAEMAGIVNRLQRFKRRRFRDSASVDEAVAEYEAAHQVSFRHRDTCSTETWNKYVLCLFFPYTWMRF